MHIPQVVPSSVVPSQSSSVASQVSVAGVREQAPHVPLRSHVSIAPAHVPQARVSPSSQAQPSFDAPSQSSSARAASHTSVDAPAPLHALSTANRWETQVSRYGAGDRYGWHLDRLGDETRQVSIVYYLFEEPHRFDGGVLELSSGLARNGERFGGEAKAIAPFHDRAVIFSARAVHRVTETELQSDAFGDGRFSVNIFCGVG